MGFAMTRRDPIKVYDARWEEEDFTDDEVRRLLEASLIYGRSLGVDTVTITRDARLGAGRVMELAVEAALRLGFRTCVCADPVSTPQSYFHTLYISREYPGTMGLSITASHNPAGYVGIKYTVPTVRAIGLDCGPSGGLSRIRTLYHSSEAFPATAGAELVFHDLRREYIDYSLETAGVGDGDLSGLSVVLDTFNGSAGPELYTGLKRAGVAVEGRRLTPDGRFPTGSPNPISRGKMDAARALTREAGHTVAIGVDGDGDRLVFGDGRGILAAGFVAVPVLQAVGNARTVGRPVLYDPKVNPLALVEWHKLNVKPVLFRNGHSQIKDYMQRLGALAGAEESGHYYHELHLGDLEISGENSLLTLLLFLSALKKNPDFLDHLWTLQAQIFTTGEFNYAFVDDATRDRALETAVIFCTGEGAEKTTTTPDGIDLQGTVLNQGVDPGTGRLEQGWYSGYIRVATNEKGVVRSYFSAGEAETGEKLEREIRAIYEEQFKGEIID